VLHIEQSNTGAVTTTNCGLTLVGNHISAEITATGGMVTIENNTIVSQDEVQDGSVILGTVSGSRFAFNTMVNFSGRDGTAIVLGCTTSGGPRAPVAGRAVVGPLAGPTAAARRALAELMVTPEWLERHPDGADAVLGDPTMTQAARRGHRIASARHDASAALHRIDTPALVLHGTEDAFCPAGNADLLVAGIAGAALRVFEGARHAYFLEHRAAASAAVLAHLAAHPVRTTDRAALPD